jgi:hypothetical protein
MPLQAGADYPALELVGVEESTVQLGKPRDFPSFGWDNEYGHKEMRVKVRSWGWRACFTVRRACGHRHTAHADTTLKLLASLPVLAPQSFRASKHLVTNGLYYEFVCDGGYFDRANWTDEGWRWRSFRNTRHPTFWVRPHTSHHHTRLANATLYQANP